MSSRAIPPGWVQLQDGSYSPPSAIAKGIVSRPSNQADDESKLHEEILGYCRSKGWPVVHSRMDRPSTSSVGSPDFVVACDEGRTIWAEAKTGKGKLSTEQHAWIMALKSNGHKAGVVRSLQEFIELIQ
jgi:hypothetical protein